MLRMLKTLVLVGMFFGSALVANAQASRIQIRWYSDYTPASPVIQYSNGGKVGGDFDFKITVPPNVTLYNPLSYISYRATKALLISKSGAFSPTPLYVSTSDGIDYYTGFASIANGYYPVIVNGDYTVIVSSNKTVNSNGQSVTTALPDQSIDFTIANPYIAATRPADPNPIIWNPNAISSQTVSSARTAKSVFAAPHPMDKILPFTIIDDVLARSVPISVTVDGGCYRYKATVSVGIYDPVSGDGAILQKTVILNPGKNVVTLYWDGTFPLAGAAQPGAYTFNVRVYAVPGYVPGSPAPSGYLASYSEYSHIYPPDWWSNPYFFGAYDMDVQKVSDDGVNAVFSIRYSITDDRVRFPNADSFYDCSGGQIDVYKGVNKILTKTLKASDVTDLFNDEIRTGVGPDAAHTVLVTIPSDATGGVTFIASPLDNAASRYDSHKPRYLQCAYKTDEKPSVIAWAHGQFSGLAKNFYNQVHAMGYDQVPDQSRIHQYFDWYHDPVIADIRDPLQTSYNPPSVAFMGGHGDIDGTVLSLSSKSYVVTQAAYNVNNKANPLLKGVNCLILETLSNLKNGAPNKPLAYMSLMVLDSCDMQEGIGTGGIPDVLLKLGVSCVVVLGQHKQNSGLVERWLNDPKGGFFKFLADGKTIQQAANAVDAYLNSAINDPDGTLESTKVNTQKPFKLDVDRKSDALDDAGLPIRLMIQSRVLGNGGSTIKL